MIPPPSARAQNGVQALDFFLRQLHNQAIIEEQRALQRQHQEQLRRMHQEFASEWDSCHRYDNIGSCDTALSYPFLSSLDQQRLLQKRAAIVAGEEQRARARQEDAERQRREELERANRAAEARRSYTADVDGCRRYHANLCDAALRSELASADSSELHRLRAVAVRYASDRAACRDGADAACEAALASPAVDRADRDLIAHWRRQASFSDRMADSAYQAWSNVRASMDAAVAAIADLPISTLVATSTTAFLALVMIAARNRTSPVTAATPPPLPSSPLPKSAPEPSSEPATNIPASGPAEAAVPQPGALVRDTPAALQALELAHAYIEEVRQASRPAADDKDLRKHQLNTLALAAQQLEVAQRLDPDAMLEGEDEDGRAFRFTIIELKAQALLIEGLTHQTYDTRRAIPALTRATVLDPHHAGAFYALGLIHAANMHKASAVAAFERAVALDPRNIAYRKELNRAQSVTGAEIAAYKATRAGERIFDAGIQTANAGIMAWNIFAITWNVLTFPLRLVLRMAGVR